jgi:soluble epoxide hydrolase / lipid-phosphate phosphatase
LWDIALEGRGHWLMIEAKDDVTRTVLKWLDEMVIPKVKL